MSTGAWMKRALAGLLLSGSLVLPLGCGVIEDTLEQIGRPATCLTVDIVSCRVSVDGKAVTTHRSEGSRATAKCERRIRLGTS